MRKPTHVSDPASSSRDEALGVAESGAPNELVTTELGTSAAQSTQGPLGKEDLALLEAAFQRRNALARAVTLARVNAASLLVTALLCLPFGAAFDAELVLVALVLGASGCSELRGANRLKQFDPRAPRWLGVNQLVLLGATALYCAIGLYRGMSSASPLANLTQQYPELAGRLSDMEGELGAGNSGDLIDHAYRIAIIGFYLALLGACALYQGLCAYFYFTRAAILRAHLTQTPSWVLQAQRRLLGW